MTRPTPAAVVVVRTVLTVLDPLGHPIDPTSQTLGLQVGQVLSVGALTVLAVALVVGVAAVCPVIHVNPPVCDVVFKSTTTFKCAQLPQTTQNKCYRRVNSVWYT